MEALTGLGGMRKGDRAECGNKPGTALPKSTPTSTRPKPSSPTTSPSVASSVRDPLSRTSLSHAASNRHASDTLIGLMDSTVPVEAMVSGVE